MNKVSRFLHCSTNVHWIAVKQILQYLRATPTHGIHLTREPNLTLNAYSNADWAECPDDCGSTSGNCIFLGPNKKQPIVDLSSTEAEYRSVALNAAEIFWITYLLDEFGISNSAPILWCDNISATYLVADPVSHQRTKHIEIDIHLVRDLVAQRKLSSVTLHLLRRLLIS